jgi:hypothetical protein
MCRWFGRRLISVRVWLSMGVVHGITMMAVTVSFVHPFMEHLCFLPGMLTAGRGGEDQRGRGEGSESSLFHE